MLLWFGLKLFSWLVVNGFVLWLIMGLVGIVCLGLGLEKWFIIGFFGLDGFWFISFVRFGEDNDFCNFGFFIDDCFFIWGCWFLLDIFVCVV